MVKHPSPEDYEKDIAFLQRLYPKASRSELEAAKRNLDRYFAVAFRIIERIDKEKAEAANIDTAKSNSYDDITKVEPTI